MCLLYDESSTKSFKEKNKNKKYIIVWKVYFRRKDGNYINIFYSDGRTIKPSTIVRSNRSDQKVGDDDLDEPNYCCSGLGINRGIHVYLTREKAQDAFGSHAKVVKCYANMEDFVACDNTRMGNGEAVFMKIKVGYNEKRGPE